MDSKTSIRKRLEVHDGSYLRSDPRESHWGPAHLERRRIVFGHGQRTTHLACQILYQLISFFNGAEYQFPISYLALANSYQLISSFCSRFGELAFGRAHRKIRLSKDNKSSIDDLIAAD